MNIDIKKEGKNLTLSLEGRLDTTTASGFEAALNENTDGIELLVMDFEKLEYISSAGLRIILSAQKLMNKQGKMIIKNINSTVAEIFEITGFTEILTLE